MFGFNHRKKDQHSEKIQLTEQSCVLKEIGMSKRPTFVAVFKKRSEPLILECATSTLNTLSIKFIFPFCWGFIGCLTTTA